MNQMTSLPERIQTAIDHHGIAWSAAAIAIGLSAQAASKWKKGQISRENLQKLADLTGVNIGWLLSGDGEMIAGTGDPAPAQRIYNPIQQHLDPSTVATFNSPFARVSLIDGIRYVPIVGDATMGPDGYYYPYSDDNRTGDGYLRSLLAGPFAYALRGVGGCMHPAVRDGWFVVFDPEQEPVVAEYVHVCLKDGRQTIKEFMGVQGGLVTLLAVNEMARITIPMDEIEGMAACIEIMPPSRRIMELPAPVPFKDDLGP